MSIATQFIAGMWDVHRELFGDVLTAVDPTGNSKEFHCLVEDFIRVSADQMAIDNAGIRDIEVCTVLVNNQHLEDVGVVIDATLYFVDRFGQRWDYSDQDMIARNITPIAGAQCLTQFRLRKSAEVDQTDVDTTFTWE